MTGCHTFGRQIGLSIGCATSRLASTSRQSDKLWRSDKRCRQITFRVDTAPERCASMASRSTRIQSSLPEYHNLQLAGLLCGMKVDVCLCPRMQRANQRPLNLDKQRCADFRRRCQAHDTAWTVGLFRATSCVRIQKHWQSEKHTERMERHS